MTAFRFRSGKSLILLATSIICLLTISTVQVAFADDAPGYSSYLNDTTIPKLPVPDIAKSNTGAYTYTYHVTLPKGRNDLEPTLDLQYNNQDQTPDSWFGLGWSMPWITITRLNKTGSDQLYTDNYFTSSLSGELVPVTLTDGVHGTYAARVETGDFLLYTFDTTGFWTITDKLGTVYTLGDTDDSQLNNAADTTQVYRWYIRKIETATTNYIRYEYAKDGNQVYPYRVNYTGGNGNDGSFNVYFDVTSRTDPTTSYQAGFAVETNDVVSTMVIQENGADRHHFDFTYTTGTNGTTALLASVTETGYNADGTSITLSPETFDYSSDTKNWTEDTNYSIPMFFKTYNIKYDNVRQADVNGDGLVDLIQAYEDPNTHEYFTHVYLNKGDGTGWEETDWTWPTHCKPSDCYEVEYRVFDNYSDTDPEITLRTDRTETPVVFNEGSSVSDSSARLVDVNGDGLSDLVESYTEDFTYRDYYKSTWDSTCSDPYTTPYCYTEHDGVVYSIAMNAVYLNTGSGWELSSGYTLPVDIINYWTKRDRGVRFTDVNGDGLVDILESRDAYDDGTTEAHMVYLNNGDDTGWTEAPGYELPVTFTLAGGAHDNGVQLADLNGDGLTDIIRIMSGYSSEEDGAAVYINSGDGTGWIEDPSYSISLSYTPSWVEGDEASWSTNFAFGWVDYGLRLIDVNSDQLPDLVLAHQANYYCGAPLYADGSCGSAYVTAVFINTGISFAEDPSYTLPDISDAEYASTVPDPTMVFSGTSGWDEGVRITDINGDGLDDFVMSFDGVHDWYGYNYDIQSVFTHNGNIPNLLTGITLPQGASTSITYQSATVSGAGLPFVVQTVASVSNDDGLGHITTLSYETTDGSFYYASPTEKRFAGFGEITVTNNFGFVTEYYFHQGNDTDTTLGEYTDSFAKIGHLYRQETYDGTGKLFQTTVERWEITDLGYNNNFVRSTITTTLDYDGNADHKDRATEYNYDTTTGNLTQMVERGEVTAGTDGTYSDTGSDARTTDYTYASSADGLLRGYTESATVKNQSDTVVSETKNYYDDQALGTVVTGNKTSVAQLISGTGYATSTFTYTSDLGLLWTQTDPNGNTTTYTYDSYGLYPNTVTNALSQTTTIDYDYSAGKPSEIVDPNGMTVETTYDPMGRVTEQQQSDMTAPTTLVTGRIFTYDDTDFPRSMHETDYLDDTTSVDTYAYFDGFNRLIQTRREREVSDTYAVTDIIYDRLMVGNYRMDVIRKQSLPYAGTGSAFTGASTHEPYFTNFTYDALGRIIRVTNALGTTTHIYDQWQETVTDPLTHRKQFTKDAYGRLTAVVENNATGTPDGKPQRGITTYSYDAAGNLTQIKDALNNIRTFTYDGLGHQLTATDLHGPADTTYGTWTYTYDEAGTTHTIVDPNGTTTTYAYDALNRVTQEDNNATATTDLTYTYDSCTDGIGRLCTATTADGTASSYTYDIAGHTATETKTIEGTPYTTSYTYDRSGNPLDTTEPDNSIVRATYNTAGLLETIADRENGAADFTTIVTGTDYTPNQQIHFEQFGNGAETTYTYDPTKMFRLQAKETTAGTTILQNYGYRYDAVGNITTLTNTNDLHAAVSATFAYDDLARMLTADQTSTDTALTYNFTYGYNLIGNIVNSSDKGSYAYNGNKGASYANPHAVTNISTTGYKYDKNGNLMADGTFRYSWNYKNQLTSSRSATNLTGYTYDATGVRVVKMNVTTGEKTIYVNGGYEIAGTETRKYISGPGGKVATVITNSADGSAQTIYSFTDHLTGSNVDTDESGAVLEFQSYKPYGEVLADTKTGTYENRYKFTGKELDEETNLYYYGARYYNADIGRFVSEDPAQNSSMLRKILYNPQNLNFYSYTRNNPVSLVDPDGRYATTMTGPLFYIFGGIEFGVEAPFMAGVVVGGFIYNIVNGTEESQTPNVTTIPSTEQPNGTTTLTPTDTSGLGVLVTPAENSCGVDDGIYITPAVTDGGLGYLNYSSEENNKSYGATPDGHPYTKHGYERGQERDISGEQIDNTINNYTDKFDASKGKTGYYDSANDITVITGSNGEIVTTHNGKPAQLDK